MITLIKQILLQYIDNIDSGNSNITQELQLEIIELLLKVNLTEFSKTEAADYIGKSKATFDNYIKLGLIPKGKKRQGFNELSWSKYDLDNFLKSR